MANRIQNVYVKHRRKNGIVRSIELAAKELKVPFEHAHQSLGFKEDCGHPEGCSTCLRCIKQALEAVRFARIATMDSFDNGSQ